MNGAQLLDRRVGFENSGVEGIENVCDRRLGRAFDPQDLEAFEKSGQARGAGRLIPSWTLRPHGGMLGAVSNDK